MTSNLTTVVTIWPHAVHAQLAFQQYATVSPTSGWSFAAGEFTGDSRADLAAYHPSDGSVWTAHNTGSAFRFRRAGTLFPSGGWSIMAGEFAGNSAFDIAAYHPNDGSVWVAPTPSPAGPDLMVRRLEVTASPTLVGKNVQVPVRLVLRNQHAVGGCEPRATPRRF